MKRTTGVLALAMAVSVQTGGALGAEDALTSSEVLVTASRSERPVAATPGSVVIIEQDAIQEQLQLSNDPADLLQRMVPGFSSSNQTISGAAETFRGRSIQVLVNGISRNTPLRDVSRIISLIDLNQVARIEVVNGASGIYGNGATGGIINFITKQGGENVTEVSLGFRSFTADLSDSLAPEYSVSTSGLADGLDYYVAFSGEHFRDAFDGDGKLLPEDPMLGQGAFSNSDKFNGNVTLGYNFGGDRLEASFEAVRLDQDPDFYSNYATSPVSPLTTTPYAGASVKEESYYAQARYQSDDIGVGSLDVAFFYNDVEKRFADALLSAANPFVYYSGNPFAPISQDGQTILESRQFGVKASVDSDLSDVVEGMAVTWGVDLTRDETEQVFEDGVNAIAPMEQDSYAAFFQVDQWLTDWLMVRGGARYERFKLDISDFTRPIYVTSFGGGLVPVSATQVTGGDFTYDETVFNLGAVAFVTDEVEVFGGFSQGYSIPDVGAFTRRAGTNTLPVIPPTVSFASLGIEAAVVDNYEVGTRVDLGDVRANLSGFISTSDLGTNFDATLNRVAQQEEEVYGVEFSGEWDVDNAWTVGTLARWTEGKRDTTGDGNLNAYLPNNRIAPPLRLTGYVNARLTDALSANVEATYLGERDRHDGTVQAKIGSSFVVNLGGTYRVTDQHSVTFGVRNLFDRTYQNAAASANRNFLVNGFGRQVSLRFATTF